MVPAKKQAYLLLDCGANVECRPEMLAAFAVMGSCYAVSYTHLDVYKRQDDDLVRLRAQSAAMQKKAQEEQGAKETGKRASRMSLYLSLIHIFLPRGERLCGGGRAGGRR